MIFAHPLIDLHDSTLSKVLIEFTGHVCNNFKGSVDTRSQFSSDGNLKRKQTKSAPGYRSGELME